MTSGLSALPTLEKDLGSLPSIQMVAHNHANSISSVFDSLDFNRYP